jgi:2-keto-4-pentenoate hydratase/2-oxohepta-3-ene-1,7-dioic acid hydratase in catechol pathway
MKLATIEVEGQKKSIASINKTWYDLQKIKPSTPDSGLLDIINQTTSIDLSNYLDLASARIPTPERFVLPYRPRQIICVGRNYPAHAKELGNAIPSTPLLFNKLPSSCIGDGDFIEFHPEIGRVDYEGEIGVIIGNNIQNCSPDDAIDAIFGYTLVNDITARDIQQSAKEKGNPWLMAKSMSTFCPIGPYITTRDELPWPFEINIELKVNGKSRQHGNTKQFTFDIPTLIAYISSHFPLFPGDIIATGTPEGVSPVEDGDLLELTVPSLGTLRNKIRHK